MRRELSPESRRIVAGEYIPASQQPQPIITVHVHNHTGGHAPSGMAMGALKTVALVAAGYFAVMYMQGYAPSAAVGIVQDRVAPVVPEIRDTAKGWVIQARDFAGFPVAAEVPAVDP